MMIPVKCKVRERALGPRIDRTVPMSNAEVRSETATAPKETNNSASQQEPPPTLSAIRSRSVVLAKYFFWALSFTFVLLVGNTYLSLVQRWLALLEMTRQVLGIGHAP